MATGLSVIAEIDKLIYSSFPLRDVHFADEKNYFIINDKIDNKLEKFYKRISLSKQASYIYLLCKENVCYPH